MSDRDRAQLYELEYLEAAIDEAIRKREEKTARRRNS